MMASYQENIKYEIIAKLIQIVGAKCMSLLKVHEV